MKGNLNPNAIENNLKCGNLEAKSLNPYGNKSSC